MREEKRDEGNVGDGGEEKET